jgi:hypothetical protein
MMAVTPGMEMLGGLAVIAAFTLIAIVIGGGLARSRGAGDGLHGMRYGSGTQR